MNPKNVLVFLVVALLVVATAVFYFWTFRHNETLNFLVNTPLTTLATKNDQADPQTIWPLIVNHTNPPSFRDDFDENTLNPVWDFINLNGKGIVTRPPIVHAANAEIIDGHLVLSVMHDPDFDSESSKWSTEQAAEQYNNAYVIGFGGYSPTPTENIVIESKYAVTKGYHGSTGIWIEEKDTFNPLTGAFDKPFRSFGTSYIGGESQTFLSGNQLEAVVGFVPVCAKKVGTNFDITEENVYKMIWSLIDQKQMKVELFINGQFVESCVFPSFYPGEIQLWADNYKIHDLDIGFLNVPEGMTDQIKYDYVSVTVVTK